MAKSASARLAAVKMVVEQTPDKSLRALGAALGAVDEGMMGQVRKLIVEELASRAKRDQVFMPIMPLTQVRPYGLARLMFHNASVMRAWRMVREEHPDQVREAMMSEVSPDSPPPKVFDVLCAAAAKSLHAECAPAGSETERLATCLGLCALARKVIAKLPEKNNRIDEDRAVSFRVMFKDAGDLVEDGGPILMEMVSAHLPDPARVLQLIAVVSGRPNERFLAETEYGLFGEQLLVDAKASVTRLANWDPRRHPDADLSEDFQRSTIILGAFEQFVELVQGGRWRQAINDMRQSLARMVETQIKELPNSIGRALPSAAMRSPAGKKMSRSMPDLSHPLDEAAVSVALMRLKLLSMTRAIASASGFSVIHTQACNAVDVEVTAYSDALIGLIHDGEIADLALAKRILYLTVDFLKLAGADGSAESIRRRAQAVLQRVGRNDAA